jgi:hypothetical protein
MSFEAKTKANTHKKLKKKIVEQLEIYAKRRLNKSNGTQHTEKNFNY